MDQIEVIDNIVTRGIHISNGTIFLFGLIDSDMALRLAAQLQALDADLPGGLRVFINSEGGEESAGFAMFDLLKTSPMRVTTVGVGSVASIAALVFQAGDERIIFPECRLMVHNGTCNFGKGDIQQNHIIDYAKDMSAKNKRYATLIAERSGLSVKKVESWCRGDKYFSASEAVALGLADATTVYPKKVKTL